MFPGGHLPSVGALVEAAQGSGLTLRSSVDIGERLGVSSHSAAGMFVCKAMLGLAFNLQC